MMAHTCDANSREVKVGGAKSSGSVWGSYQSSLSNNNNNNSCCYNINYKINYKKSIIILI